MVVGNPELQEAWRWLVVGLTWVAERCSSIRTKRKNKVGFVCQILMGSCFIDVCFLAATVGLMKARECGVVDEERCLGCLRKVCDSVGAAATGTVDAEMHRGLERA